MNIQTAIHVFCDIARIEVDELLCKGRKQDIAELRMVLFYVLRKYKYSYPEIARATEKHHTTIMAGVKRGKTLVVENPRLKTIYREFFFQYMHPAAKMDLLVEKSVLTRLYRHARAASKAKHVSIEQAFLANVSEILDPIQLSI